MNENISNPRPGDELNSGDNGRRNSPSSNGSGSNRGVTVPNNSPAGSSRTGKMKHSDIAGGFVVAIVHRGYPTRTKNIITRQQFNHIENIITMGIDAQSIEEIAPQFRDMRLNKGVLLISCVNENSRDWLRFTIESRAPQGEESRFVVIEYKDLQRPPRVKFWLRENSDGSPPENMLVLERIKKQNIHQGLDISQWRIIYTNRVNNGFMFFVQADEESVEWLNENGGRVSYLTSTIAIKRTRDMAAEPAIGEQVRNSNRGQQPNGVNHRTASHRTQPGYASNVTRRGQFFQRRSQNPENSREQSAPSTSGYSSGVNGERRIRASPRRTEYKRRRSDQNVGESPKRRASESSDGKVERQNVSEDINDSLDEEIDELNNTVIATGSTSEKTEGNNFDAALSEEEYY